MENPNTIVSNRILGWSVVIAGACATLAITMLHLLKPDLDPLSHAISEYVYGPYGALMTITFFVQCIGSLALAALVIRVETEGRRPFVGGILFVISAVGAAVAGVFPADPVSPYPQTSNGIIHAVAGMIRFLALAFALPLLSSALSSVPDWRSVRKTLTILAILFVVTFLVSIFVLANLNWFGLGQRIFISLLLIWMFIAAYPVIRRHS